MNPFDRKASSSSSSMNAGTGDPFKATKMWDEIVYAFCMGMPAKRRRRGLKVYDDCFTGRKAVTWMHNYLMFSSHFCRHEVSRFQALQLLRKFLHHSIIQRIDCKEQGNEDPVMSEFKDNRDLYTMSPALTHLLPVHEPILPDEDTDPGNLSMDLEAEPVPSSSSSLPSVPAYPPAPALPVYRRIASSPAAASLNCCTTGSATGTVTGTMTRSPLKPVNRSNSSRIARVRKIPNDVFWL